MYETTVICDVALDMVVLTKISPNSFMLTVSVMSIAHIKKTFLRIFDGSVND